MWTDGLTILKRMSHLQEMVCEALVDHHLRGQKTLQQDILL